MMKIMIIINANDDDDAIGEEKQDKEEKAIEKI